MNSLKSGEACLVAQAGLCGFVNDQAPDCGTDKLQLSPYPLAEDMCRRALAGRRDFELQRVAEGQGPALEAIRLASAAGYSLELGLSAPTEAEAAVHFADTMHYADDAMHRPYSIFRGVYAAALTRLYQPLFIERRESRSHAVDPEFTAEQLATAGQGFGIIYDALLRARIHEPDIGHILVAKEAGKVHLPCLNGPKERAMLANKLIGFMAAARHGVLLYPATDREAFAYDALIKGKHDAHRIVDGQKQRVRFGMTGTGTSNIEVSDEVLFVNVRRAINYALEFMIQHERRYYDTLLQAYRGKRPDVLEVGALLQVVMQGRENDNPGARRLVNSVTGTIARTLLAGNFTFIEPRHEPLPSQLVGHDRQRQATTTRERDWEALPAGIVAMQLDPSHADSDVSISLARQARARYLAWGNQLPNPVILKQLIAEMRGVNLPDMVAACGGAYMDLARHPEIPPKEAVQIATAGLAFMRHLAETDWQDLPTIQAEYIYRCGILRSFGPKYLKALGGEALDLEDETRLYLGLINVGNQTLEPSHISKEIRGVQAELGLHELIVRHNLRTGRIDHTSWPSAPREDSPRDFNFQYRTAWDLAVNPGAFLDQGLDCRRVQCKSDDRGIAYDPGIIVVTYKDDLQAGVSSASTRDAAIEVAGTTPAVQRQRAGARLNAYEGRLLRKLGLQSPA